MSCYRSGGALPIPLQSQSSQVFKKSLKTHNEDFIDIEMEEIIGIPDFDENLEVNSAQIEVIPVMEIHKVTVTSVTTILSKPEKKQSCTKHTRCHCDLLGQDTEGFHALISV